MQHRTARHLGSQTIHEAPTRRKQTRLKYNVTEPLDFFQFLGRKEEVKWHLIKDTLEGGMIDLGLPVRQWKVQLSIPKSGEIRIARQPHGGL